MIAESRSGSVSAEIRRMAVVCFHGREKRHPAQGDRQCEPQRVLVHPGLRKPRSLPFDNRRWQCVSEDLAETVTSMSRNGAAPQVVRANESRQIAMISAPSAIHASSFIGLAR
jgi:hypothetical protein